MGMLDKFKDLVGLEEIEEEDFEEEVRASKSLERRTVDMAGKSETAIPSRRDPVSQSQRQQVSGSSNVVSMQGKTPSRQSKLVKLVVINPGGFEECPKLVDGLKARKPIIVNLEKVESDVARKIFDFLSGATYALNGNVQKIATNIFVFAPENIDIAENLEKTNFEFSKSSTAGSNTWR